MENSIRSLEGMAHGKQSLLATGGAEDGKGRFLRFFSSLQKRFHFFFVGGHSLAGNVQICDMREV